MDQTKNIIEKSNKKYKYYFSNILLRNKLLLLKLIK